MGWAWWMGKGELGAPGWEVKWEARQELPCSPLAHPGVILPCPQAVECTCSSGNKMIFGVPSSPGRSGILGFSGVLTLRLLLVSQTWGSLPFPLSLRGLAGLMQFLPPNPGKRRKSPRAAQVLPGPDGVLCVGICWSWEFLVLRLSGIAAAGPCFVAPAPSLTPQNLSG